MRGIELDQGRNLLVRLGVEAKSDGRDTQAKYD